MTDMSVRRVIPAGGLGDTARHPTGQLRRSRATRIIHLLLLLSVLNQLVGSQFMAFPFPGDPPSWIFSLHEYVGLASLGFVAAFWAWTLVRRGETRFGRLLPWFSRARLADMFGDLAAQLGRLAAGRLPDDEDGALASAVHGLGLLTITAMALTGTVFFVLEGTPAARLALQLHKLIANLAWVYLIAHAAIAMLHHLLGSDIFARMFWASRR